MKTTQAVEIAAKRFFYALVGGEGNGIMWDNTDHRAKPLLRAAFKLYSDEWNAPGRQWDIRQWTYPAKELRQAEAAKGDYDPFGGNEPWTVLLRRALELTRPDLIPASEARKALDSLVNAVERGNDSTHLRDATIGMRARAQSAPGHQREEDS